MSCGQRQAGHHSSLDRANAPESAAILSVQNGKGGVVVCVPDSVVDSHQEIRNSVRVEEQWSRNTRERRERGREEGKRELSKISISPVRLCSWFDQFPDNLASVSINYQGLSLKHRDNEVVLRVPCHFNDHGWQ